MTPVVRMCLARLPDGRGCPNRIRVEPNAARSYCPQHHHLERHHQSSAHARARELALDRAGGRCQACGTPNSPTSPLHMHHRNSVVTDNRPENLVMLCARHHRDAHRALRPT
jgi:hypothetical protein